MEIGIDCVEISRFKNDILSKKNILNKIFTEKEIEYCENKEKKSQHYAVRFAGKEAVVKALNSYGVKVSLKNIEILKKENGSPYVRILNNNENDFDIKISLSHSNETAIAVVLIFKD